MSWGKHLGITIFFALIMVALFFVHAEFFLIDTIVPGIIIEDWISNYEAAGIAASMLGVVTSAIWFFIGINHNGSSSIATKYLLLLVLSLILGGSTIFMLDAAIDGAGCAKLFLPLGTTLIYYLSSLFASADAVRNVPPLSDVIH